MSFKYDPGDCSCCDATPCCNSKTTDCGSGYDPQERCCCLCASPPPCELDVTIGGVTNDSEGCVGGIFGRSLGNCSNCANYNGTYSLTKYWSNNAPPDGDENLTRGTCEWWGFFNCEYDSTWPQCESCSTGHIIHDQINMIQVVINYEGKIVCRVWDTISYRPYFNQQVANWCDLKVGGGFLKDSNNRPNDFFAYSIAAYSATLSSSGDLFDCEISNLSLSYDSVYSMPGRVGNNMCDWTNLTISISAG